MTPFYQLFANVEIKAMCGNRACTKNVKASDLKSCGQCGMQKNCSKYIPSLELFTLLTSVELYFNFLFFGLKY